MDKQIPELDGLRAVAIGLVIMCHIAGGGPGWIGVDLFFVLSGFLITGICVDHPRQFRVFYARRALRIIPPYALALSLISLNTIIETGHGPAGIGWLATFTTNIGMALTGSGHAVELQAIPFWSLAVEEQFYILWPLLIALFPVRRMAVVAIAAALIFRVYVVWSGAPMVIAQTATVARMDGFAVGGLLAVAYRRGSLPRIRSGGVGLWALWLLAVCGAVNAVGDQSSPAINSFGYSVVAVLSGFLIAAAVSTNFSSSLRAVLRHPVMRAVGQRSYAMYLFHVPVLAMFPRPSTALGWIGFVVAGSGLTFGVAALSWRAVEAPALALKKWFPYVSIPHTTPNEAPQHALTVANES